MSFYTVVAGIITGRMYGIIYLITNNINGRLYVGQTTMPLNLRWNAHKCAGLNKPRHVISQAIAKHGPESFTITQICTANNREELDHLEKLCIVLMDCRTPKGYNSTPGGDGYMEHTEETRLKMSEAQKGKKHTEETRLKISEGQKGKVISQAHREAVSRAQTGLVHSAERRAKRSKIMTENNPFKGKKHTEETRKRMSEARKGKATRPVTSDETREKLRKAHTGRTHTEETLRRLVLCWTPERKAAMAARKAEWWAAKRYNMV